MPTLSLAMIVRDDAAKLDRCLRSVKEYVDEMIVVDTGSTDGSQGVARNLGARVVQKEWPGAFDTAVNWSIEEVKTTHAIRLDSDEWLHEEDGPLLRKTIESSDRYVFNLYRYDLLPHGGHSVASAARLWKMDPRIRFQGVIHEQVPIELAKEILRGELPVQTQIRLWHDGYQQPETTDKVRRNLPLLRKELELRPGQIYYEIHLARTLLLIDDPEGEYWLNHVVDRLIELGKTQDQSPSVMVPSFLAIVLDRVKPEELRSSRVDEILRLVRGWCLESPPALWSAAQICIKRGDLRGAYDLLLELEGLATSGRGNLTHGFNPMMLGEGLWTNLALVAHQLGKRDVARVNYEKLLKLNPRHPVASVNIHKL